MSSEPLATTSTESAEKGLLIAVLILVLTGAGAMLLMS